MHISELIGTFSDNNRPEVLGMALGKTPYSKALRRTSDAIKGASSCNHCPATTL